MSAPNLQNICLEQYINSVQNTENDPIYSKLCEQEEEMRCGEQLEEVDKLRRIKVEDESCCCEQEEFLPVLYLVSAWGLYFLLNNSRLKKK